VHGRFYMSMLWLRTRACAAMAMSRLLDHLRAEGRARGCRKLLLDTALDNTLAHRFYYRQGLLAMSFRFNCLLD
jgi:hypothetical protein